MKKVLMAVAIVAMTVSTAAADVIAGSFAVDFHNAFDSDTPGEVQVKSVEYPDGRIHLYSSRSHPDGYPDTFYPRGDGTYHHITWDWDPEAQ